MPIEIRELVIRATVRDDAQTTDATVSGGGRSVAAPLDSAQYEQLLQDCVRQVLLALARERER